jgi:hypothetical protein
MTSSDRYRPPDRPIAGWEPARRTAVTDRGASGNSAAKPPPAAHRAKSEPDIGWAAVAGSCSSCGCDLVAGEMGRCMVCWRREGQAEL